MKSYVTIVSLSVFLIGCGSLVELPKGSPAPDLYNLTSPTQLSPVGSDVAIRVEDTRALAGLDSNGIARRSAPTELQYFAGARWSARVPAMVHDLLIESFENVGQAVFAPGGGAVPSAGYEVQTEIRDFQAEYYGSGSIPRIRIRWRIRLVQLAPVRQIMSRDIEAVVQASGSRMPDIIAAFNEAFHEAADSSVRAIASALESPLP